MIKIFLPRFPEALVVTAERVITLVGLMSYGMKRMKVWEECKLARLHFARASRVELISRPA